MRFSCGNRQPLYAFVACAAVVFIVACFSVENFDKKGADDAHGIFPGVRGELQDKNPIRRLDDGAQLCNGHANLCDKRANEILYATLHNANNVLEYSVFVLPNHKLDLGRALEAGYRGLNMDFGKCEDEVSLLHVTCLLQAQVSLESVLAEISDFLDANPNEVLILPTEITPGDFFLETPTVAEIDQAFQSVPGFYDKLYDHPGPGEPWPTLKELIDSNKRILFFFYNAVDCTKGVDCPTGFHPWFAYATETQFSFPWLWSLFDKNRACEVTRGTMGTRDFFGVNVFVTPPRLYAARFFNSIYFLRDHLQNCKDLNGGEKEPNLVLVDYWKVGDVLQVVSERNAAL